jgi:hypothetical protein
MNILIRSMTIKPFEIKKKSNALIKEAQKIAGLQFLTWVNTGSPSESATPPIRWGVLRGSSSVFFENESLGSFKENIKPGSEETPDPLLTYNGPKNTITIIYNVEYAFKMHEERGKTWQELGPISNQSSNATDKWLEKHIASDGKILYNMIARLIKKGFSAL